MQECCIRHSLIQPPCNSSRYPDTAVRAYPLSSHSTCGLGEDEPDQGGGACYTLHDMPFPIMYGMHCNKRWSGGHIVLRNSVGGEGGERGAQTKGVFASNSIDSCTKASN